MTFEKLHLILDNPDNKLTLDEFKQLLYELKNDCIHEQSKIEPTTGSFQFYAGEANAFMIALDLAEHILNE